MGVVSGDPRPSEMYFRTCGRLLPTGAYVFEHVQSSLPLFLQSIETRLIRVLGHETSGHSSPKICLMNSLRQKKALLSSVFNKKVT